MQCAPALLLACATLCAGPAPAPGVVPELPRDFVDTTHRPPSGRTLAVPAGGDFQAALDEAQPGDVITLEAGATFTGPFTLPRKGGEGWIEIRTNAPDASLPSPGSRITPAHASVLPRIVSPGEVAALRTEPGARHYRILGVEFTVASGVRRNYGLIQLGEFGQTSIDKVPHHLVLDRVYIHGAAGTNLRRGVALNSAWTAVIDSHISEIHEVGADAQALVGSSGPGPFKIVNNYLEGSGENLMFGGADPAISNLVPSDIEIRGNHFTKPLAWMKGHPDYRGTEWTVKNLFELKNARRVIVDGNLFEHNWPAAQTGFAILLTVRNQDGKAPWSVVEDVTFTNNVVRHVSSAINVLGYDDNYPSRQTRRILIENNLFEDIGGPPWGGMGRFLQLLDGTADVVVEHNTVLQTGEIIVLAGRPHTGFVYRDNVARHNLYGVAGDDHFGDPPGTFRKYLPGAVFTGNVITGGDPERYPAGNRFPAATANAAGETLTGDGVEPGVDLKRLGAAQRP